MACSPAETQHKKHVKVYQPTRLSRFQTFTDNNSWELHILRAIHIYDFNIFFMDRRLYRYIKTCFALVNIFGLRSILPDTNTVIPTFSLVSMCMDYHFPPILFMLKCVFKAEVNLLQAAYRWVLLLIHWPLCLLIGEFNPCTFRVITGLWGRPHAILLFCTSIVSFSLCFCLPLELPSRGVFCPTVFSLLWFSLSLYQYTSPTVPASSCGMTQTFVSYLVLISHQTASWKSLLFSEGGTITQIGVFFLVHRLWPVFWALSTGALLLQHTLEGSCRIGGSMGLALRHYPQGRGAWVWCTQSQWVDFLLSTDSRNQVPYLPR